MDAAQTQHEHYFNVAFYGWAVSVVVFLLSLFIEAPYGKLGQEAYMKVGPIKIPNLPLNPRIGWFLMELPSTVFFLYYYPQGKYWDRPLPLFLAALFLFHYANRGFYFPYSMRVAKGSNQSYSIIVVLIGWLMTSLHGYLSARWYSEINLALLDAEQFVQKPYFIVGFLLYEFGFWNTVYSEYIVRNLRTNNPNEPKYKIPRGGGFEYVTNAAYFFELLGWLGFAIMTLNPGGLYIFLMSSANLVPRAFHVHTWYKQKFGDDYPKERRVLIPFLL